MRTKDGEIMRKGGLLSHCCVGATAGLAGTLAMTATMIILRDRRLLKTEMMPKRITQNLFTKADVNEKFPKPVFEATWVISHFVYGAGSAALSALISPRIKRRKPILSGVAFGSLLWAVSYLGLMPMLGLYPSPFQEPTGKQSPRSRVFAELLSHIIYGIATDLSFAALSREDRSER